MNRMVLVVAAAPLLGLFAACAKAQPETAAVSVAGPEVSGGEWFKQTGCASCHSISAYNVLNVAAAGPDLSFAVDDVPRRFGVSLDEFLQAPTGTMAMVLSTRIPLTPEQRILAVAKLKAAYRRRQEQDGVVRPVASH